MARPRHTVQSVGFHLCLPGDVYARMALHLHSEAERRMPVAARSRFISQLIKEYFLPQGGISKPTDPTQIHQLFHLVCSIRDLSNHPLVNPAEAIPLIAKWSDEITKILHKEMRS